MAKAKYITLAEIARREWYEKGKTEAQTERAEMVKEAREMFKAMILANRKMEAFAARWCNGEGGK